MSSISVAEFDVTLVRHLHDLPDSANLVKKTAQNNGTFDRFATRRYFLCSELLASNCKKCIKTPRWATVVITSQCTNYICSYCNCKSHNCFLTNNVHVQSCVAISFTSINRPGKRPIRLTFDYTRFSVDPIRVFVQQ